jgi:hypothetical protein
MLVALISKLNTMDLNSIVGAATSAVAGVVAKATDMAEQVGIPTAGVEALVDKAEAATGMDLDGKPEVVAEVTHAASEAAM